MKLLGFLIFAVVLVGCEKEDFTPNGLEDPQEITTEVEEPAPMKDIFVLKIGTNIDYQVPTEEGAIEKSISSDAQITIPDNRYATGEIRNGVERLKGSYTCRNGETESVIEVNKELSVSAGKFQLDIAGDFCEEITAFDLRLEIYVNYSNYIPATGCKYITTTHPDGSVTNTTVCETRERWDDSCIRWAKDFQYPKEGLAYIWDAAGYLMNSFEGVSVAAPIFPGPITDLEKRTRTHQAVVLIESDIDVTTTIQRLDKACW